jgi:predicted secreted protein
VSIAILVFVMANDESPALRYEVIGCPPLILSVDVFNPSLASLYKLRFVKSCAFLTAGTSAVQPTTELENLQLRLPLGAELQKRSLNFSEGVVKHSSPQSPDQESLLIWALSLEAAKMLGIKYGQSTILWCGLDAVPRLVAL